MQILAEVKNLWMKLNLRGAILMSLSLQVFLIFFAPIRKRCSNWWIVTLTWSAYLVADLVADYALGLIAKAQFTGGTSESKVDAYGDLLAFWAPFLLLHLGGPDTITAFALEDNELWLRHLLNLLFQLGAAGYVFYESLPSNKLIVATILMFIGGITKYIERTRALYLASFSKFRDSLFTSLDTGPNYAKLMEEYYSMKTNNIPVSIETKRQTVLESVLESPDAGAEDKTNSDDKEAKETSLFLDNREVIKKAFGYFTTFKGLLVGLIFSFRERNESVRFFRSITPNDAFRVVEAELNFFYDVLYTKAAVVHRPVGYLFRAISIGSIITAFVLFYVLNKQGFHEYDIQITYTLLLGAVGLEFVALSMLICSDWTIALSDRFEKHGRRSSIGSSSIKSLLKFRSKDSSFALHILHGRWSKSIFQYNLIDSRLKWWPKWIQSLRELFDDLKSGQVEQYKEKLGELIFDELKRKSSNTNKLESMKERCDSRGEWASNTSKWESIKERCDSRGEWALERRPNCKELLSFVRDVDYGESILMWHIATELCYNTGTDDKTNKYRKVSKVLSDYMLYLMIKRPIMMSAEVGIWKIRFQHTCAEIDRFIGDTFFNESKMDITKERVCNSLLSIPTVVKPADVKGNKVKSVLFDACILAKELGELEETKWKILSEVWVELLTYAAIHCRPYVHAQQLSKGGELITLVWLLMVHLGLSELFQPIEDPRAKLIIHK
ncbi:hypothetical protein ACJRO7_004152 [Eucalyptus globulus]|uniref:DUF4220 domain-containing protein n=1 Tax=Eucalyptus globulus TaxID=34317 RepID=A0ABD3IZ27_EUCGL